MLERHDEEEELDTFFKTEFSKQTRTDFVLIVDKCERMGRWKDLK